MHGEIIIYFLENPDFKQFSKIKLRTPDETKKPDLLGKTQDREPCLLLFRMPNDQ